MPAVIEFLGAGAHGFGPARRLPTMDVTTTPEWKALAAHFDEISPRHLRDLFAEDPERAVRLTAEGADLSLDYSKHRVDRRDAAPPHGGGPRRPGRGAPRRHVRRRAHQHHRGPGRPPRGAAHAPGHASSWSTGRTSSADVHAVLGQDGRAVGAHPQRRVDRCDGQADRARSSTSGSAGSDLGPAMATEALADYAQPGHRSAGSSPTSTRSTSTPRPTTSTRPRRCSSSAPRRSPPSRP